MQAEHIDILNAARARVDAEDSAYAGDITPPDAWALATAGVARLVDVRTAAEVRYVGNVPGSAHVEWHGTDLVQVERFIAELRKVVQPDDVVLLLCRSGVRSRHAGNAAARAGFAQAFNVLEGFEGQRNHAQQRGLVDGWRKHGLPWIQD